jgi:hypothetical protein
VTGLAPNAAYNVNIQSTGNGAMVSIASSGTDATTDNAGVLKLTF